MERKTIAIRQVEKTYLVKSIDLLRLGVLVCTAAIRAIRAYIASEKAGRGGADCTAERADLRLCGTLAGLPCDLEGLEGVLHLLPRRRVPRLEPGLVRVDELARVLHARLGARCPGHGAAAAADRASGL